MLIIHPVVELARALPALAGLLLAGQSSGHGSRWSLIATVLVAGAGTLRYFTTRFRVTPAQIQLRHGLFRRRTVSARLDRVRSVDVTAHPLHRVLGLSRVVIGTGTSDRKGHPPLTLDGLRVADAARLRNELLHRAPVVPVPAGADETELFRLPAAWVRYAPVTLSGAVSALAIAGFAWRLINEAHVNPDRFGPLHALERHVVTVPIWQDVVEVSALAIGFVAVASTVGYVLAFWNFRLTRHAGGTLHVTRGLVTARATSIEESRLRGAELSEPLLLRAVGGARTLAITTGLRVGRGAERGGTMLVPPGPRAAAQRIGADVVGDAATFTAALLAHGPRARRRRYVRAVGSSVAFVAAAALIWWLAGLPIWAWLVLAAVVPLSVPLAADRAASLGHALVGDHLVTRRGSFVRRRAVLARAGVIGVNVRSSVFQRRAGLVTLTATTAAGRQGYRVQDVPTAQAIRIADTLLPGLLNDFTR
jgi:putative membrane protein